jgi:hypothetical protein
MPSKRTTVPRVCPSCGETFWARPIDIANGAGKHCSYTCSALAQQFPLRIPADERDLIYLAGLIDGEGTITALCNISRRTGNESVHARIMLANTHRGVMEWIATTFGGKLAAPRQTRSPKHKPVITWYLGARPAVALCERLVPYLKVKRRQAEMLIVLDGLPYVCSQRGRSVPDATRRLREPLVAELRTLNHRGVLPVS